MATTTIDVLKVQVIARETIKPSSPTPPHLKTFKLSLLDQGAPLIHTPVIFFYAVAATSCGMGDWGEKVVAKTSKCLKESLSKILTCFYPFAGRLKDKQHFIDCNDDGVDYLEARVNRQMSDVLKQPKMEELQHFLPTKVTDINIDHLLLVQANFFECGGLALGVSLSHKIADGATIGLFMKDWASTAAGGTSPNGVVLDFKASSLFPPSETESIDISIIPAGFLKLARQKKVMRRYVFNKSQIAALKAKAASTNVQQPTRVEVVSAFLWKCSMATSRSRLGYPNPSTLFFPMNMRKRLVPPLPEYSIGNMAGVVVVKVDDDEMDLHGLVHCVREGVVEYPNNFMKKHQGAQVLSKIDSSSSEQTSDLMRNPDAMDWYGHTSWCRFPLYEADFGWGKPTWVSVGATFFPNFFVLVDTRESDGIEAWVTLNEEDMVIFEHNKELLEFASHNPSAL